MKKLLTMLLLLTAFLARTYADDTWTVAAEQSLIQEYSWDVTATANDMTAVDGTSLYYLTKTLTLNAQGYSFKVVKNHSWDNENYPSENRVLTVDAAGTYDVTFWFNSETKDVYATYVYSIKGNLWDNWATDKDMVQDAENPFVYTLTIDEFEATAGTKYEYKLHANHAWADYELPGTVNQEWTPAEGGNYKLTFTANVTTHTLTLDAEKIVTPDYGYLVDFNTAITTSNHDFTLGSNWGHIVGTYDDDGDLCYMSYSYSSAGGVDGTGALLAYRQYASGSSYGSGGSEVYDLLVSPLVSGTITLDAKLYSTSNSFVEFYKVTGTPGAYVMGDKIDVATELTTDDFTTISFTLDGETRIGIRASYVYIDNFTATNVSILTESKLNITEVKNAEGTSYTTYFAKNADGTVTLNLKVTIQNTGDVDLKVGDENYTLSPVFRGYYKNTLTYFDDVTYAITEDIAAGETATVDVEFTLPSAVETGWIYIKVKENVSNTVSEGQLQSQIQAYESKFVFREANATSTSSLTAAQSWGTVTESTTKSYEIFNNGTAPLTVNSITLPDGFTSTLPATPFEVAKGEKQVIDVTLDAATQGTFTGNLVVNYTNALATEATDYTLAFSATVIGANTWTADFNNSSSTVLYPAGSIAEGGIDKDSQYSNGNYNNWIIGRTTNSYVSENNKFITPLLHAAAGDKLAYDVKGVYGNNYYAKVYVSTDRKNWGEPVAYYTYAATDGAEAIGSSSWQTKTITFDTEGDYYVAFSLYGKFAIDNLVGLEKVDVAHDLYLKEVTWPEASIKSGSEQSSRPKISAIPLTDEAADSYTVKYVCGETVLATLDSKALTASATSATEFAFTWTPEVENTTVYEGTKVVFEFTDGTKIETEEFDLTITNEAIFHFVNSIPSSKWNEPNDRSENISFGNTNTVDTQNFYIYNWGTAPLTVKSISLTDGFTTTTEFPLTVVAMNESDLNASAQALDITFSAETAGIYSGDMVITYVDGNGNDATFTLGISGTRLDPSKFYANFDGESSVTWPAGSVYQSNISSANVGTYDVPNYCIYTFSDNNNLFVTPKLTVEAGEKMVFDAKAYSAYNAETATVKVYAATSREEVLNAEEGTTRVELLSIGGEENPLTANDQTFEITIDDAGEYYIAFEIYRAKVDEIYGYTVTDVDHDWTLVSSNIPTEAMQNVAASATMNILNFGIHDEEEGSYTITAYVDGEPVATSNGAAIPMSHKQNDAGTSISVSFRYPKVGTFPVYVEVKAGDYSVATDPVDVVFAEEEFINAAIQVGTKTGTTRSTSNSTIVDWYNADGSGTSYTDVVYSAAKLAAAGIMAGDKITTITFKHSNSSKSIKANVTSWVAMSTSESFSAGSPDKGAMQEIAVYDGSTIDFPANFEMVLNLPTPIVYDGTSDIRIYTETVKQGGGQYMSVTTDVDSEIAIYYNSATSTRYAPLAYFTLAAEPAVLSGIVTDGTNAVEGATVTLVSTDGDNIQYTGTTDSDGAYSINVIQATRDYTATVTAEGYDDATATISFGGETALTQDFVLTTTTEPIEPAYGTIWTGKKGLEYWTNSVDLSTEYFKDFAQVGDVVRVTYDYEPTYLLLTNNMGWSDPKVHYWGGEAETSWPGVSPTLLYNNDYGQDVYGISLPEGTTGVVFNNNGGEQTVDITDLTQLGYYMTDKNDAGKFEVAAWDGNNTQIELQDNNWTGISGTFNGNLTAGNGLTVDFILNEDIIAKLSEGEFIHVKGSNATVTKVELIEKQPIAVTISESTYATLYYENVNLVVPEGVTAYAATMGTNSVKLTEVGEIIPAGVAVVINGDAGTYEFEVTDEAGTEPAQNDLIGSEEGGKYQEDGFMYYVLCWKNSEKKVEEVGFYRQAGSAGAYAQVKAHQAYLRDDASTAKSSGFGFSFEDGIATGINAVNGNALNENDAVYTLSGVRVNAVNLKKGVYIVNGKKVTIK